MLYQLSYTHHATPRVAFDTHRTTPTDAYLLGEDPADGGEEKQQVGGGEGGHLHSGVQVGPMHPGG